MPNQLPVFWRPRRHQEQAENLLRSRESIYPAHISQSKIPSPHLTTTEEGGTWHNTRIPMQANFGGREDRTILHQAPHQTSFTSTSHQLQHFRNLHLVSAHKEACRVHQTVAHGVEYSKHACYSKYAIWSSELRPQMAQYNRTGHVVAKVRLWHCRVYKKCPCTMGNVCKASKLFEIAINNVRCELVNYLCEAMPTQGINKATRAFTKRNP